MATSHMSCSPPTPSIDTLLTPLGELQSLLYVWMHIVLVGTDRVDELDRRDMGG